MSRSGPAFPFCSRGWESSQHHLSSAAPSTSQHHFRFTAAGAPTGMYSCRGNPPIEHLQGSLITVRVKCQSDHDPLLPSAALPGLACKPRSLLLQRLTLSFPRSRMLFHHLCWPDSLHSRQRGSSQQPSTPVLVKKYSVLPQLSWLSDVIVFVCFCIHR